MAAQPFVIFVENLLPLDDDDHEASMLDAIAAVYHPVLESILGSSINRANMIIAAVYLNFPQQGWFRINPRLTGPFDNITQQGLQRLLTNLFITGEILDPVTNEQIFSRVGIADVLANLQANNTRIIGCYSGEDAAGFTSYRDHISTLMVNNTYAFVLGEFADGDTEEFIDVRVKVSNYALMPHTSAYQICIALANKWNID